MPLTGGGFGSAAGRERLPEQMGKFSGTDDAGTSQLSPLSRDVCTVSRVRTTTMRVWYGKSMST